MNSTQKIIKYIAMAFGIVLAINIIGAIAFGILTAGTILTGVDLNPRSGGNLIQETIVITEEITNIDINVGISRLEIRQSEQFEVILNNVHEDTVVEENNGVLRIIEGRRRVRFFERDGIDAQIIVYIPKNAEFEKISIESDVGRIYISSLVAEIVDLEIGVGEVLIGELIASQSAKIEGGVGRLRIDSGNIRNLNLDSGVGETIIRATLTGNARIEGGVGRIQLIMQRRVRRLYYKYNNRSWSS